MLKPSAFPFLLIISVANCQFFYNYEEKRPDEYQPETQNYDSSVYQYNPPSAVNQQYLQPSSNENQPIDERGNRRARIRVRSRNYQSEPNYNEPQPDANVDQRAARQERRQARRRQRQNDFMIQPVVPPRVFGPSIFENIGLGEAPTGVYVPSDSFLNVLRNQRSSVPQLIPQPVAPVPQARSYVQPSVDNTNSGHQPRFFVQPPSNDEPRQPNVILPVSRPAVEYVNTPVHQTGVIPDRSAPSVQARTVRGNSRSRPRIRMEPEHANPPTVDIDALREYRDDFARDDVMPHVQYAPTNIQTRPQSRRRTITNIQETTSAPRVYSPSVFERVGLGEAPTGVYVPEDSLLNSLRNPSGQYSSHRTIQQESPLISASQPAYFVENDYEEEYQPPPPPPPTRRRAPSSSRQEAPSRSRQVAPSRSRQVEPPRTRQVAPSRRSQVQYLDEYQENKNVQADQPSSQRRRGDDYEDFERQKPPVRHRTQTQRKPAAVPAPRTQPQSSQSDSTESTFRKAKLAIAELPQDTDEDGIPGEAGVNYPTLHVIPKTSFSCSQQSLNGYYADLETSCQVVHLCQSGGVQDSFLCPNGTIFSQEKFSCQWWYKVNCNDAPKYYIKNDELYKVPEKKERKRN